MNRLSLRARLLLSYLLLLAITLSIITVAVLFLIRASPAPPQPVYQELLTIYQSMNLPDLLLRVGLNPNGRRGQGLALRALESELTNFAQTNEVRALIVNAQNGAVIFDSAGMLSTGDTLAIQEDQVFTIPVYLRRLLPPRFESMFGSFHDPGGTEWLFAGLVGLRADEPGIGLLLAQPRPRRSFESVAADFRAVLQPVCQSAMVGLVIAFVLAVIISRNVAHSLQRLAHGAAAVAQGNYDQRIPESGPPEVRAVAQAFNHMSTEVHDTQQAQQDFLANVSHDLKTPLTSIQGYAQAILDGAAKDPAQAATIIYEEAGRLNRMVIELTDLARLEAGRLSMKTSAVDMGQIATAVGQRLAVVAGEKGITLRVQASPMPPIAGDGDRLAQVITNLISNAIKYTPNGGQVWVTTHANNGGVEVSVKDTGVGILRKDLQRIFERFYQVDRARGPERGTGLGLAITQEIVQAHGGKLTVTSPGVNQGSTFTVWLPFPHSSTVVRGKR
jgi:signal transduction histidine kinase